MMHGKSLQSVTIYIAILKLHYGFKMPQIAPVCSMLLQPEVSTDKVKQQNCETFFV